MKTHSQLRNLVQTSPESILENLTQRQFVLPHRPIAEVLADLGTPAETSHAIMGRLSLDPATAIGRLKRCQLTQLSRVVHREWRDSGKE